MLKEQTSGEQRELLGREEVEMSPEGQAAVKRGELRAVGRRAVGIPGGINSLCKGSEA